MKITVRHASLLICVLVSSVLAAANCSTGAGSGTKPANLETVDSIPASGTAAPAPTVTPSNKFTPADVAKLKWLEGTWRGMDGETPFYERYRFDGATMVVESLDDKGNVKPEETTRFELNANGEFGPAGKPEDRRAGASSITDASVQFVPFPGSKGNSYRFEKRTDGKPGWNAVLEWPASSDKPARQKFYEMQPWSPAAK
ncbi:MAG TPA: hypothetical protein VHL50_07470 [Pyrinomonadaceae bacterium]|nr:hypothetical protein [Pyrinomonadaceae bacterium]